MLRRIGYRDAFTALIFTGLWFALGLILLFSGIPTSVGIGREMFTAWLLLFFAISAVAGGMLTMAAINGIWPPVERPPQRPSRRTPAEKATPAPQPAADTTPLPWSTSPLPQRGTRRGS
jgi:hypothetical protein